MKIVLLVVESSYGLVWGVGENRFWGEGLSIRKAFYGLEFFVCGLDIFCGF